MYLRDTIAAVATPPGEGAMAVIRLSGSEALSLAARIFHGCPNGDFQSHRFYYGRVMDPDSADVVDEVMLVAMMAPRSYTREDVVEIHCHGGSVTVRRIFGLLLQAGARVADPGEFTRRAYLNGRIDLTQAESVLDIIRAKTYLSLALAQNQRAGLLGRRIDDIKTPLVEALAYLEATLDFPEDEVGSAAQAHIQRAVQQAMDTVSQLLSSFRHGRIIHDGATVLIAGVPNVGKSSLMNALLEEERAIVTPIPGTTRDIIEDSLVIDGISVRLLDTAGLRHTEDPVEQAGVQLVRDRLATADLVLLVLDASRDLHPEEHDLLRQLEGRPVMVAYNKCDLTSGAPSSRGQGGWRQVAISARTGVGLQELKQGIHDFFVTTDAGACRDALFLTNRRHSELVRRAGESLERYWHAAEQGLPMEIGAMELRLAVDSLGEITGAVTTDDLLDVIFGEFCVGK